MFLKICLNRPRSNTKRLELENKNRSFYQVRRKCQLQIGRFVVTNDNDTTAACGARNVETVSDVCDVDVAEFKVPEAGDGDEQVPGQHRAHAQVAKDDAGGERRVRLLNF